MTNMSPLEFRRSLITQFFSWQCTFHFLTKLLDVPRTMTYYSFSLKKGTILPWLTCIFLYSFAYRVQTSTHTQIVITCSKKMCNMQHEHLSTSMCNAAQQIQDERDLKVKRSTWELRMHTVLRAYMSTPALSRKTCESEPTYSSTNVT
jgi:hypothetical protein